MTSSTLLRRTALVTGASGGIGRATARLLAQSGANLILHGHTNRTSLESLVAELQSQHPALNISTHYADLSLETEQDRLMDEVSNSDHIPDILVLAAGIDLMSEAMKRLPFEIRLMHLWQVDVVSAMRLARFIGERMRDRLQTSGFRLQDEVSNANPEARRPMPEPRSPMPNTRSPKPEARSPIPQARFPKPEARSPKAIVFFGWDGTEYGMAGETAQLYAAAKGAIQGFSRSLAYSLAPEVRVNCVAPGWIKTTWGETASSATNKRVASESLARRWGTAEEVAEVVRFLVSDEASYINNQTIFVNGGRDMAAPPVGVKQPR